MPAKSEAQRRFMGMQLSKKRAGKKTSVRMSEDQLSHFAKKGNKALQRFKGAKAY